MNHSAARYIASALGGALAATLIFVLFVIPEVRASWQAQGRNEGEVTANWKAYQIAEKYFSGSTEKCSTLSVLLHVKALSLEVIQCGTMRTLRVVK